MRIDVQSPLVNSSRQRRIQTLRQTFSDDKLAWNLLELHVRLEGLPRLVSTPLGVQMRHQIGPPSEVASGTQYNPPIRVHYRRSSDISPLAARTFCTWDLTR
jgi:hypothetical protein